MKILFKNGKERKINSDDEFVIHVGGISIKTKDNSVVKYEWKFINSIQSEDEE